MSIPTLVHDSVIAVLFVIPALGLLFLGSRQLFSVVAERRAGTRVKVAKRGCKYCLFGRARMTEQKVHVEQDDLVTVRCWVCSSCGLPHWTVSRSPVLKPVSFDK